MLYVDEASLEDKILLRHALHCPNGVFVGSDVGPQICGDNRAQEVKGFT